MTSQLILEKTPLHRITASCQRMLSPIKKSQKIVYLFLDLMSGRKMGPYCMNFFMNKVLLSMLCNFAYHFSG
jgi:hypothetical protein